MEYPDPEVQTEEKIREIRRPRRRRLDWLSSRWFQFLLTLLIALTLGLVYGWVINPVEYRDTTLNTLHTDYQTDYVLMVAETYSLERNVELASNRLAALKSDDPIVIVTTAIEHALTIGYTQNDLVHMQNLLSALQTWNLTHGSGQP